jgi:hypothetical protein
MKLFEVEKIIDSKIKKGVKLYEVSWVGYKETTWEPKENLKGVKNLVEKFEKKNPLKEKSLSSNYFI